MKEKILFKGTTLVISETEHNINIGFLCSFGAVISVPKSLWDMLVEDLATFLREKK